MMAQCTAMTRSSGGTERCQLAAMHGTTVCNKHGGRLALASLGNKNPQYKHGRHSKLFKQKKLADKYWERMNDPELLAHRSDLAVLDVLLDEELESLNVDAGAALRLWKQAADRLSDFEIALMNRDQNAQQEAFLRLRNLVREGQKDAEARKNARSMIQERSQLATREQKRLLSMEQIMTSEQAYMLFQSIMWEINDAVQDRDLRSELNRRLQRLGGRVREVPKHIEAELFDDGDDA